ncbi:hypothetical protein C4678_26075, partial [Salmonella enterica subsp. enterica serovar Anatum]
IHNLSKLLHKKDNNMKYGENAYTEEIENGHIENADSSIKIKIKGYSCKYMYYRSIANISQVDFSEQIKAIVEDFITGKKKWVLKNGIVK